MFVQLCGAESIGVINFKIEHDVKVMVGFSKLEFENGVVIEHGKNGMMYSILF